MESKGLGEPGQFRLQGGLVGWSYRYPVSLSRLTTSPTCFLVSGRVCQLALLAVPRLFALERLGLLARLGARLVRLARFGPGFALRLVLLAILLEVGLFDLGNLVVAVVGLLLRLTVLLKVGFVLGLVVAVDQVEVHVDVRVGVRGHGVLALAVRALLLHLLDRFQDLLGLLPGLGSLGRLAPLHAGVTSGPHDVWKMEDVVSTTFHNQLMFFSYLTPAFIQNLELLEGSNPVS